MRESVSMRMIWCGVHIGHALLWLTDGPDHKSCGSTDGNVSAAYRDNSQVFFNDVARACVFDVRLLRTNNKRNRRQSRCHRRGAPKARKVSVRKKTCCRVIVHNHSNRNVLGPSASPSHHHRVCVHNSCSLCEHLCQCSLRIYIYSICTYNTLSVPVNIVLSAPVS